jgi:hypothetical protein
MTEERSNLNFMGLAIPAYLRQQKHKPANKEKKQIHISEVNFKQQLNYVKIYTAKTIKLGFHLTLILLTATKWWAPACVSKWRMGFNSAFKGLTYL